MGKKRSGSNGRTARSAAPATEATRDDRIEYVAISQETRRRYLNYAMSVIQSRALPDVRDGLKPVQRRILYVMYQGLRLTADGKPRKCAKICGDTTGNFHPHGEMAVYDALVRMAQDHTYRYTLITGQGNFGSVMGLPPAAPRYTEAKLTAIAEQLMNELRYDTIDTRPNYDATSHEPVVLPARFPNLLVNGTSGIAVGMATNIPPHNLSEVIGACVMMIDDEEATVARVMKYIKGPDFPLGGRIVSDRAAIKAAYTEGRGAIKVRGEWKPDKERRKSVSDRLVVHSVPYNVDTSSLVAEIGAVIENRKLPQLLDVADETDDKQGLRVVLEIKPGSDPEAVMAYLYKHTSLEQNFAYNATCLVPDEHGTLMPARVSIVEMLRHFLDFRHETVRRRFAFQLAELERRIHILEGFRIVFEGIEKALRIIRRSRGKQDAAVKLMREFPLDEVQTIAILEMQLYKISRLEIDNILEELAEKQAEADRIRRILSSPKRIWGVVKKELQELDDQFGDRRRTSLGSSDEIAEFDPQAYIVRENTNVVVTRDGWIKRVGRLAKVENTRVREGDAVLDVLPASTLDCAVFFASDGTAYTLPIDQVPVSSGYGDPLSKHVRLKDGVSIVGAVTTDERFTSADHKVRGESTPGPYLLIVTRHGQVMRFSFSGFRQASTKVGRKYCRLGKEDAVVTVELVEDAKTMFIGTKKARLIHFPIKEVPVLSGPGKGVKGIRLEAGDEVLGAVQLTRPSDCLYAVNTNGKELSFGQMKYNVTSRGGKGVRTSHRTGFEEIVRPEIELVDWSEYEET